MAVVCDSWYIHMIRYSIEFASNDYENYVAAWKDAHDILLSGKVMMQNYMYIMIMTIITYDYNHYYLRFFLCRNREYSSTVKSEYHELYHNKRVVSSMFITQTNKSTEYILY